MSFTYTLAYTQNFQSLTNYFLNNFALQNSQFILHSPISIFHFYIFELYLIFELNCNTCSWVCWDTSRPFINSTWSPSLRRGMAMSAGVPGATLDTIMGMPWSAPPYKNIVQCIRFTSLIRLPVILLPIFYLTISI